MTNMKMISPINADEDVGGGKDNDTNQR
uniref:Uncharacterized protein n=1 Tax=Oryza glaberrima TaxID=4538 RepID=I1QWV7_ORYGL